MKYMTDCNDIHPLHHLTTYCTSRPSESRRTQWCIVPSSIENLFAASSRRLSCPLFGRRRWCLFGCVRFVWEANGYCLEDVRICSKMSQANFRWFWFTRKSSQISRKSVSGNEHLQYKNINHCYTKLGAFILSYMIYEWEYIYIIPEL